MNGRDPTGECLGFNDQPCSAVADRVARHIEKIRRENRAKATNFVEDALNDTLADLSHAAVGTLLISMGSSTGAELGAGQSALQVAGNRAYEILPLEEARALVQDWDQLDAAERTRLISMGVSKTAGLVAGTAGGVESVSNFVRSRAGQGVAEGVVAEAGAEVESEAATAATPRGGADPVRLGQAGEEVGSKISGLPKNTRRIRSASGKRSYRVPDHMDSAGRYIQEDKAVKRLYRSSQVLDDKAYVLRDSFPGRVDVLIDEETEITTELLHEHLNPGSPIKLRTGKLKK